MQITIVAVGKKMPPWIDQGAEEYTKRFPTDIKVKLVEVATVKRNKSTNKEKAIQKEATSIDKVIKKDHYRIALDERGTQCTTKAFSQKLETWLASGRGVVFIVGGADGLDPSLMDSADEVWSLSKLTLPHAMVRVLLLEQLYRAWSILNKHPYHRE